MTRIRHLMSLGILLLGALSAAPAMAAQGYDSCTGFIDTLPASITTQGTWCLRGHKYTSQFSGAAINVLADNITVDCNHFRLSGLGGGAATAATGIVTDAGRLNVTVRNCRIQGFRYGVFLRGAHHLIEHNRLDHTTYIGIYVIGDRSVIRENEVMTTGGVPGGGVAYGIYVAGIGSVTGNVVQDVRAVLDDFGEKYAYGIFASGLIEDNHVAGLDPTPFTTGITAIERSVIRRNTLVQSAQTAGLGIQTGNMDLTVCRDNDIVFYQFGIEGCDAGTTNLFVPAFVIN